MPSFEFKKGLRFIITLGVDQDNPRMFGDSNNNQITLEGFRATVDIDKAGGQMMGTLHARIYGVTQSDMNSITTLQYQPGYAIRNTVQVFAIDGPAETLIFSGDIVNAWGDYLNMPDVFLQIQAVSVFFGGLQPVPPLSISGGIDVAIPMERIADGLGLAFENNNVHVILSDVYVANTFKEQALELATMCNFWLYIDDKVLAITNKYESRAGQIPEISAASGLMGYPTFDGLGVNFRCLFNPAITFGGSIKLVTDIKQAAGQWIVTSVGYRLDAEKPGGLWMASVRGNKNGLAITS